MDISSLKPTERLVEIRHPGTGDNLGITVSVLSLLDDRMKKIKRRLLDNRLQLESKGKKFKSSDVEDNETALLFEAMTGWQWNGENTFRGEKPDFNIKNVKEVFTELEWFRNQIAEAVSDEEAFFTT
jgi:hypothetical protein